jgi:DNA-binding transcriptional regulator YhcF (GntR family)
MAAPYLQIVDEIRARIAQGRLRPGERVPSARQITQEWGVAIATATKALATLQAEGLVRAVVGVGTIVAPPPAATHPHVPPHRTVATGSEAELTKDRIVATAVAIADTEGLAAVTMRRLATELGVAVMSLYRHVPGKDELVVLMADWIFAEAVLPDPRPDGWRAQLEAAARLQWALARRHPWMSTVMSLTRPMLVPHGMAHTNWIMQAMHDLGFDLETSLHIAVVLAGFLLGIGSSLQLEAEAERDTGISSDEWMETQEEAFQQVNSDHRFPMLEAVSQVPDFDLRLDDLFEFGLGLLLDGLAGLVAAKGTPAG